MLNPRRKNWFVALGDILRQEMRWLTPGIGVKRWLIIILTGTTLVAIGIAILILDIYRTAPTTWWLPLISTISLRFIARPIRALVFGSGGIGLILWGIWGLNRALLKPFMQPGKHVLDTVSAYRRRERGPKIVVVGGGTGLSTLLRGIKTYSNNLTAVVTVADDGGSSGEIRKNIGILPPGDIRNCLAALSNDETLLTQLFQYRFAVGAGLEGHTLGNLLITALTDITGSFEEAVAESGRVLAVQGRVLPSTLHDVSLVGNIYLEKEGLDVRVKGESNITKAGGKVNRVWLEPNNPLAFPPALQAILAADLIIVGPGSLYTSILPNLLVPDIIEAIRASRALKFYVSNISTQPGETDGYSAADCVNMIEKHVGGGLFDLVVCNNTCPTGILPQKHDWIRADRSLENHVAVYESDLLDNENPWRHDSTKLGRIIMDLFFERTGPLVYKDE